MTIKHDEWALFIIFWQAEVWSKPNTFKSYSNLNSDLIYFNWFHYFWFKTWCKFKCFQSTVWYQFNTFQICAHIFKDLNIYLQIDRKVIKCEEKLGCYLQFPTSNFLLRYIFYVRRFLIFVSSGIKENSLSPCWALPGDL
jgi:hypothetical protein